MAETVQTPRGKIMVLTLNELEVQRAVRDNKLISRCRILRDGSLVCMRCGDRILGMFVAYPIWDGPFPQNGSGRCLKEKVGYCPNCDPRPEYFGIAIAPKGSYHNP